MCICLLCWKVVIKNWYFSFESKLQNHSIQFVWDAILGYFFISQMPISHTAGIFFFSLLMTFLLKGRCKPIWKTKLTLSKKKLSMRIYSKMRKFKYERILNIAGIKEKAFFYFSLFKRHSFCEQAKCIFLL